VSVPQIGGNVTAAIARENPRWSDTVFGASALDNRPSISRVGKGARHGRVLCLKPAGRLRTRKPEAKWSSRLIRPDRARGPPWSRFARRETQVDDSDPRLESGRRRMSEFRSQLLRSWLKTSRAFTRSRGAREVPALGHRDVGANRDLRDLRLGAFDSWSALTCSGRASIARGFACRDPRRRQGRFPCAAIAR